MAMAPHRLENVLCRWGEISGILSHDMYKEVGLECAIESGGVYRFLPLAHSERKQSISSQMTGSADSAHTSNHLC